jgi:hypothetical protein
MPPPRSILPSNTFGTASPQSNKFTISCKRTNRIYLS